VSVSPCKLDTLFSLGETYLFCQLVELKNGSEAGGLPLVHFSAQPEPCLVTAATISVHFSAEPGDAFADDTSRYTDIARISAHVKPKIGRM